MPCAESWSAWPRGRSSQVSPHRPAAQTLEHLADTRGHGGAGQVDRGASTEHSSTPSNLGKTVDTDTHMRVTHPREP